MANKALLFWCAGSVAICGSAALATNSLWRAPANPVAIAAPTDGNVSRDALVAAPEASTDAPAVADGIPALAELTFFEPRAAGASSLFRGSLDTGPAPAPFLTAAPIETPLAALSESPAEQVPGFAEVTPELAEPQQPAVTVLPPPRPRFQLARLEASQKANLGALQPEQPAPGFATPAPVPQSSPGFNWDEAFRPRTGAQPGKPERVIHAGIASWYGPGFHGRKTASGERFDQNDMTAAHKTLPFGTRVKVVDEKTGRSIVVRINDRGPFKPGRVIDLSKQAAQALGMCGLANVELVSAS